MGLLFSRHVLGMLSTFFKPFTLICIKVSGVLTFVGNVVAVARCLLAPGGHRFGFAFLSDTVGLLLSLLPQLWVSREVFYLGLWFLWVSLWVKRQMHQRMTPPGYADGFSSGCTLVYTETFSRVGNSLSAVSVFFGLCLHARWKLELPVCFLNLSHLKNKTYLMQFAISQRGMKQWDSVLGGCAQHTRSARHTVIQPWSFYLYQHLAE